MASGNQETENRDAKSQKTAIFASGPMGNRNSDACVEAQSSEHWKLCEFDAVLFSRCIGILEIA